MKKDFSNVDVKLINMNDVAVEQVQWLLYPFIPYGKITIIQGDPGEGKTTLMMEIIARLSRGLNVFDLDEDDSYSIELGVPQNVIYQTAEDGLGDTIKPRLIAADADCNYVHVIDESDMPLTMLDVRLEVAIVKTQARLVVLDPIQGYIGANVDMHKANEIRPVMKQLAILAQKYNCAIVLIGHMNKASGGKSSYRGLGSIDITAAARSVLLVGRLKDKPNMRIVCHVKSSLAPEGRSLSFELSEEHGFRWCGVCDISADDLLNNNTKNFKFTDAKKFLLETLEQGPMQQSLVESKANYLGIKEKTLRNAKKELNICSVKNDDRWFWCLPD